MDISERNKLWLEKTCYTFQVGPCVLLNLILDRIREQNLDDCQNLIDWVDAPAKELELSEEILAEIRQVGLAVESAAKATKLYVSLIQSNKVHGP